MKILNIVGARPNLVKIAPLLAAMRSHKDIAPVLVHTGQHYDKKLSEVFFDQMRIPEPDFNLDVGSGSQAAQTAEILKRIEPVLLEQKPDLVLVVGDVNSTVAASLAAAKLGIPIAHVEAGLRSFDRTMPEEINRVVTDALADYLFVTEVDAIENLRREGRPSDRIYFVGNVMIDALQQFLPLAQNSRIVEDLGLIQNGKVMPFAVLTLHRPSNVDSPETLRKLLSAIEAVASQITVIFPVHPRTQSKLDQLKKNSQSQLRAIAPLGYLEFLRLLSLAKLVLTDSGGKHCPWVPCLTLRQNTERPVTVTKGTNRIIGQDPEKMLAATKDILAGHEKKRQQPDLWDGHAAERIVQILKREFLASGRNVGSMPTRREG